MPGVLCLQGGREFTPECREMDGEVLRRARAGSPERPVVVLAGAARVGSDHAGAVARAVEHYESLGAVARGVTDPRHDARATLDELHDEIGLIVLPGGSPSSLIDVLFADDALVGRRLVELHERGVGISGASAGAMAMCEFCVLPDRGRRGRVAVAHGLGLVEGVALPHWTPGDPRWELPDDVHLWGLPECGGVVIEGDATAAVGAGAPSFRHAGAGWLPVIRHVAAT
ncbi:MAG: Type 1 glutamine amidotransferase-like domain-containing protein [Actinomycetota bacterium]